MSEEGGMRRGRREAMAADPVSLSGVIRAALISRTPRSTIFPMLDTSSSSSRRGLRQSQWDVIKLIRDYLLGTLHYVLKPVRLGRCSVNFYLTYRGDKSSISFQDVLISQSTLPTPPWQNRANGSPRGTNFTNYKFDEKFSALIDSSPK